MPKILTKINLLNIIFNRKEMIYMDRIMTRKLRRLLLILFVVVITVISIISYESAIANFENDMSQIINQIVDTYNSYREDEERLNELFTRDYTNRAKAINYVLSLEKQMNLSLLQRVADVMGVEGIDLIDSHGKVVMSSLGQYLDKDVLSMFEKNDGTELKFNVNIERQEYIIVKTPCTIEGYGSLIIRVNQDIYNQCLDDLDMSELMSDVPTISEETYFVVQSNNDKILGITSNNEQDIQIQGTPDISKQLEACVNGKILHINGEYQYVKTIVKDNMIFGCMLTMSSLFLDLFLQIVGIFVALVFIFLSIYILVRYTIEKYFSNDLKLIEHSVDELMNGNFETHFETKEDTELKKLCIILNNWRESYQHKTERMSHLVTSFNNHAGVFECIGSIKQSFFSDNVRHILGMEEKEWKDVSHSIDSFREFIYKLKEQEDDNAVIHINNKYIEIVLYDQGQEFYGAIIDKTDDILDKMVIEDALEKEKIAANTDNLTGLLNRRGFEEQIDEALKKKKEGVMLLMDLDNFKKINDNLGHQEGDKVLIQLSYYIDKFFREDDVKGRMGGDEFIVFIKNNVDKKVLENKLKLFIEAVHKSFQLYNEKYNFSISIGAVYVSDDIQTYEELYKKGDEALYQRKLLGKDGYSIQ